MPLTHERLLELLAYDPVTGIFTRLTKSGRWQAGDVCGWKNGNGYIRIELEGGRYFAHRLAWFYCFRRWPEHYLDHKNGDRADNRIANLREANQSQNMGNADHKNGRKGTTYRPATGRWIAQIGCNRRHVYLGSFKTREEAHRAYAVAAEKLFGEFARHGLS
jgi:hypothetical protein